MTEEVGHDRPPCPERVMRIIDLLAIDPSAVIGSPFVDVFSILRFPYDGSKELEGSVDLRIIDRISSVQEATVQVNDAFADFLVGYRQGAW